MKKFHFWVKNAVFIKNKNEMMKNSDFWYTNEKKEFFKNSDFCYTWSNDLIQQVFQISERSDQYSRRYDILNSYPLWNNIILYHFYTK